jgi:hypothetical protein
MQPPRRRDAETAAEKREAKHAQRLMPFSSDLCGLGVSAVAFPGQAPHTLPVGNSCSSSDAGLIVAL